MGIFSSDEWPDINALCWGDTVREGIKKQIGTELKRLAEEERGNPEAERIIALVKKRLAPILSR